MSNYCLEQDLLGLIFATSRACCLASGPGCPAIAEGPQAPADSDSTASGGTFMNLPRASVSPGTSTGYPGLDRRFDRWAASYDLSQLQTLLYGPVHDAVLRCAHQHIPKPGVILDVGCGTGRLAGRLASALAAQLPFADAVFDLVVATLTVSHRGDQAAGIAELSRVMAPGGVLVVADVCPVGSISAVSAWTTRDTRPGPGATTRPGSGPGSSCCPGIRGTRSTNAASSGPKTFS